MDAGECRGEAWMNTTREVGKVMEEEEKEEEEEEEEEPAKSRHAVRRPPRRRFRVCPIEGCHSKPQKHLPQHLDVAHPALTHKERAKALQEAKVLPFVKDDKEVTRRELVQIQ